MWIIPKQLTYFRFVPDTVDSNSDYPEHWKEFLESLLWRSKPTLWRTWQQRLKRVNWLSKLCGRILKPSRQKDFEDALILSLRATRANRSVSPANDKAQTTPDTFGRILKESSRQLDLFGASSRTSPDTLQSDSPKFMQAYEIWVTQLRLDCLQRQRSALRTNGKDCLSWEDWATPRACAIDESMDTIMNRRQRTGQGYSNLEAEVNVNMSLKAVEEQQRMVNWPTVTAQDAKNNAGPSQYSRNTPPLNVAVGLPAPDSPSTNGKSQELWLTPRSNEPDENRKAFVDRNADRGEHCHGSLTTQAKENQAKGKLNPAWVEQLMGLPAGWTDLDSSETE